MNALSNLQIELRAPTGERVIGAYDLPLSIGGEGAALVVPGAQQNVTLAVVGVDEHGLFVEPQDKQTRLNGRPFAERSRLAHGDVLGVADALVFFLLEGPRPRLQVEEAQQQRTAPPAVDESDAFREASDEADTESIERAAFRPLLRKTKQGGGQGRSWRWAVAAAIGLLVVALGILMAANPVQVLTQPDGADVDVTGGFKLGFSGHYLLRPGPYTVTVAHEGYETATQKLQVTDEPNQNITVSLKKLPGQVRIDTGGVTGTLEVDGTVLGAVPGEYTLSAGQHEFTVKAPRYADWVQKLEVQGEGKRQQVAAKLLPGFSTITIESKPTGAQVTVDGQELGVTPLTTELDAGAHTLGLLAAGFRRWEGAIQVKANEPQTVGPIELGLPDGKLTVRTQPVGADVTIGGRHRGRSPVEVSLAPGVQYTVEVARAGYEAQSRAVPIKAGEKSALELRLQPIFGEVTVRGEPADAQLFVDGEAKGSANQTIKLPAAETKLEIRREGYLTYTTTVTPQAGVARSVDYRLLTPTEAKAARTPAIIVSKVGGQLRLMPTGSYQMGSTRRDGGSRTNESQRAVTLQRSFYLGVKEVTNAEYLKFEPDHLSGVVKNRSLDQDDHPVVNVSWQNAVEFCNWLSQQEGLPPAYEQRGDVLALGSPASIGYRLPTEAEWEWGARHQPGQTELRIYQWGQGLPVPRNAGNYADKASMLVVGTALQGYEDGFVTTSPVGRFAANALGLFDMDGNVSEWVNDYYTVYRELDKTSATDPTGPESGEGRVIRGANWRTTDFKDLRLAWRDSFSGAAQHIGFRIARYAE